MADLVEFLRARLAEDEAAARLSWPGPWSYNPAKRWLDPDRLSRERAGFPVFGGEEFVARRIPGQPVECIALTGAADDPDAMGTAMHIARWHPARVLAEVAAKRAVLELCEPWGIAEDIAVLRLLAQPYGSHPDYDPAWRA